MRVAVILLLLVSTHLSLTAFMPAYPGKGWILWPFAGDSKPAFAFVGGLPTQPGSRIVTLLSGIATLCFFGSLLAFIGAIVPEVWWGGLVIAGAMTSAALYIAYFSPLSLLPLALDIFLLWGVFIQHWSVSVLHSL
jgi:hypothetical protein